MHVLKDIGLPQVQAVYSGPEHELWELIMGEQIHIGGLASSVDLAERAGIEAGSRGIDLCCCTGAGMRFLTRFRQVAHMHGVDATPKVIALGRQRCAEQGLADRITFVQADVCQTPLPDAQADFVWSEDAWCYVADKTALIGQAARLVRQKGTIAFTDWLEGPAGLNEVEAQRLLRFMKFPHVQTLDGYCRLLDQAGCHVLCAEDTGRFGPHVDIYLNMVSRQLSYDALRILNFDIQTMDMVAHEMEFMRDLALAGKIIQGRFVARKH